MPFNTHREPNETASLLSPKIPRDIEQAPDDYCAQSRLPSSATVFKIVLVLLVGTVTSNADSSLVLATHPTIASEFNALSSSSWLFVSFSLAGAATQTLYGKFSDIYGRRLILVIAYILFAVGCALVGSGKSMGMVILGRVISGCGGSALNVLAVLIITGILSRVSSRRCHLAILHQPRRDNGSKPRRARRRLARRHRRMAVVVPGPSPALRAGHRALPDLHPQARRDAAARRPARDEARHGGVRSPRRQQPAAAPGASLANIDMLGATLLALAILTLLLPVEIGGSQVPWTHPVVFGLVAAALLLGGLFLATEAWWAADPIFPVELLRHRDVLLGYFVTAAQGGAQLGLMYAVPLYFQVTKRVSNAVAGSYLVPAVVGNALGAILAGIVIKRTGRYKPVLVFATLASSTSYLLLLLRWHGQTNIWESLYILPSGLGTGIVQTTTFIAVQAAIDPAHKAPAMSGIFLVVTIGGIIGMVAVNAVTIATMTQTLDTVLNAMGIGEAARHHIIEQAASNIAYIDTADKDISAAVVRAYVNGLSASHGVSLAGSISAIVASLLMREHNL
ncbi:major facilitator superfamily domain-containing protein [Apiospora kogelbergensis]|uniref:Major facilitator superfamily domain-containing protein n=1 Tax=Apiospora kogelbergensis TaxID=1337665 RepID=A0AAW0QHK7_9PEZI